MVKIADCTFLWRWHTYQTLTPDPETKNVVNHKKGKKHDCRASQLEWVTQAENIQHAWDTGLCKRKDRKKVNKNGSRKTV